MNFCITKENVDDKEVVPKLTRNLTGLGAADKGYISKKLEESLAKHSFKFITKVRKNMKKKC